MFIMSSSQLRRSKLRSVRNFPAEIVHTASLLLLFPTKHSLCGNPVVESAAPCPLQGHLVRTRLICSSARQAVLSFAFRRFFLSPKRAKRVPGTPSPQCPLQGHCGCALNSHHIQLVQNRRCMGGFPALSASLI